MRKNYALFHYDSLTRIHRTSLFNYSFKFYPMLHIVKKNKNSNLFCRLQVIVFMLSEAARKMLRKVLVSVFIAFSLEVYVRK